MSKSLKLIFLGTNHFYDSPQSLITVYHENTEYEKKKNYIIRKYSSN